MTFEKMNRYQVMSRPLHIRYMFFVEFNWTQNPSVNSATTFDGEPCS